MKRNAGVFFVLFLNVFIKKIISLQVAKTLPSNCDGGVQFGAGCRAGGGGNSC